MTREDYLDEMVSRIEDVWFDDNYIYKEEYEGADPDVIYQGLYDDFLTSDDVTGSASGSYTFNRWRAKENVNGAEDVLKEACRDFGCMDLLGEKFIDEEWEWMDVTIRCYLLGEAIDIFMRKNNLY